MERDQSRVSRYIKTWKRYGSDDEGLSFNQCLKRASKPEKPEPDEPEPDDDPSPGPDDNYAPGHNGLLAAIAGGVAPDVLADKVTAEDWEACRAEADFAISVVSDYVYDYVDRLEQQFAPMKSDDEQRFATPESES